MTDRERWTVYPLLFLALGVAMRDKILEVVAVDNVRCESLVCNALVVADEQGKQQLLVSSSAGGVQCHNLFCDALIATNAEGQQQVVISSNPTGGIVQTRGNDGRPNVVISSGLLFVDEAGRLLSGSILPKAPAGQPAEKTEGGEVDAPLKKEAAPPDDADE